MEVDGNTVGIWDGVVRIVCGNMARLKCTHKEVQYV